MRVKDYLINEVSKFSEIIAKQSDEIPSDLVGLLEGGRGIATGAGDSYVASLYIQYITDFRFHAVDPLEAALTVKRLKPEYLIAISVKGRTAEVVEAAELARDVGSKVIAVTYASDSPLANRATRVVKLVYPGGEYPVGIGNFVAVLTALHILGTGEKPQLNEVGLGGVELNLSKYGEVVGVGLEESLIPSLFTCLKLSEVTCTPCRCYHLEQFLHAPIYSIRRDSLVVIFESTSKHWKFMKLAEVLREAGFDVAVFRSSNNSFTTVVTQVARFVLSFAGELGDLGKPCFMEREYLVKTTTPLIYGNRGGRP